MQNEHHNDSLQFSVNLVEHELAQFGWGQPPALFTIVHRDDVLKTFADVDLSDEERTFVQSVKADEREYVETPYDIDPDVDVDYQLRGLSFPKTVAGVIVVVERSIIPEADLAEAPSGAEDLKQFVQQHPQREDLRIVCGVNRFGHTWCAIRTSSNDDDALVVRGPNLVPEVVDLLKGTLDNA